MTTPALLNNIEHHALRVVTRHAAAFGDNVNVALVFPPEFGDVQREYPILLRKDASGAYQAVALLGLDKDENLFLSEQGWNARYVPAVQQRGPFLIGFQEEEVDGALRREPMIHIDVDNPRISKSEGEPIFLPHGGNSPYLERVARILRVIHQGVEISKPMFAAFEALDLIEPVSVEIKLDDATQYNLVDYYTIGEERLAQLDAANLERLHKAGFLRAAFFILASLGNVSRLIDLKNRKRATA